MINLLLEIISQVRMVEKFNKTQDQAIEIVLTTHLLAPKHRLNPRTVLNIMAVESKFKMNAINKRTKDYGIMQVNIKCHKTDKKRLLTDLHYSIDKGMEILGWFKKTYGKSYIARYNCGVRHNCPTWQTSKRYVRTVLAAMN